VAVIAWLDVIQVRDPGIAPSCAAPERHAKLTVRQDYFWEIEMMSSLAFRNSLLLALTMVIPAAAAEQTPAPPNASVYFINLKDGDTDMSPFKIQFGLTGMGIAPAGVERPNTGHHHLLIDTTLSPEELKQPIPMDDKHRHFGGGQTETMLTLPPGRHTLELELGDWSHVPFNPPIMSPIITITVR
jgi:hypothetical protein